MAGGRESEGRKTWQAFARYGAVGLEMGVSVAIGLGIGWWLDGKFGTKPILAIVFMVLGVAAGFRALWRALGAMRRDLKR